MAIIYIEKGIGMWNAIRTAGHTLVDANGVYSSDNDAAVQAIINAYNPLADQKVTAILALEATALQKMQTLFPALNNIDTVNLVAELWNSILPAGHSPTANWQKIINVYVAGTNGIAAVNAATTKPLIDAAVAAIVWPF